MVKVCDHQNHGDARLCCNPYCPRRFPPMTNKKPSNVTMKNNFESVMRIAQERKSVYVKQIGERKRATEERSNALGFKRIEKRRRAAEARRSSEEQHSHACGFDELVTFEILVRLPAKTLMRFKSVCKSWHGLITDPSFVALHGRWAKERRSLQLIIVTIGDRPGRLIDMYTYEEGCKRRAARFLYRRRFRARHTGLFPPQHANGLLLLNNWEELVICNPSTNESVTLPQGRRYPSAWLLGYPDYRAGLAFVPSMNAYKVCQYFYRLMNFRERSSSLGFEVMTLGLDSSWRALAEDPPLPISHSCPKSVGEVVYYKVANSLHSSEPKAFLAFNLRDEKFRVVDPPPSLLTDFENMSIVDLEGKPCFVHRSKDGARCNLWTSDDRDGQHHSWIPSFRFSLIRPATYVLPLAMREEKLLLMILNGSTSTRLEYYDPQSGFLEPLADIGKDLGFYSPDICGLHFFDEWPFLVTTYVDSLASIMPRSHSH